MPRKSKKSLQSSEQRKTITSVIRDTSYKWIGLGFPEIQFAWVIDNFGVWIADLNRRETKVAYSPEFPTEPSATKWKLVFHIDDVETSDQDTSDDDSYRMNSTLNPTMVSLYLQPVECPENKEVQFNVSLYGNHQKIFRGAMPLEIKADSDELQGYEGIIALHTLSSLVKDRDDKLIISCTVMIRDVEEREAKGSSKDIQMFHVVTANLNSDMEKLLEMNQFGDVELIVGARKFSAYKGILAARSTVFANMFQGKGNRFEIDGMEPEVFQEVLRYIYTDQVADLGAIKFQLIAAAHRFNIESLKDLCRDAILADISLDTVADVLSVGEQYEEPILKHQALALIWKGPIGLTKTRGWKKLVATHPHLADEALEMLAKKVVLRLEKKL